MRRTRPTPTEVLRVETILRGQPAFRDQLSMKIPLVKRTGETVHVAQGSVIVAQRLLDSAKNPERAPVTVVLRTAVEVFGTRATRKSGGEAIQDSTA